MTTIFGADASRERPPGGSSEGGARSGVEYTWAVDILGDGGTALGGTAVEPDWAALLECAHFSAMRRGLVAPVLGDRGGEVVPLWDIEHGAPQVRAARAIVTPDRAGAESHCEDVPADSAFFRELARASAARLIEKGVLTTGEVYPFRVSAYARGGASTKGTETPHLGSRAEATRSEKDALPNMTGGPASESEADDLAFEEIGEPIPLAVMPIDELEASARPAGSGAHEDDMRVFIPRDVVDEVVAASRAAGELEVGGILVGHLRRLPDSPEIYAEVTAQVPALYTEATKASLTFTADSWAAVDAAIELRGERESILAWWHFHPNFTGDACAQCPEERRRKCPLSRPFFSSTDVHLHKACFSRAWQTALLVSDFGRADLDVSFYGWREGMVATRGFEVVDGT